MTTTYDIDLDPYSKLIEWIQVQPNLISIVKGGSKIVCEFNHTLTEEIAFKAEIANRLFQIDVGNNIFEFTLPKLTSLQTDQLLYSNTRSITKTNISATFANLFTDFNGMPFFADFTGFTRLAFQIFWTKIGTGAQHLKIIDDSGVIVTDLINTENLGGGTGLVTGDNALANYTIPSPYVNFKGKLRIQARSTINTDDPVFVGIFIYLRR